MPLSMVKRSAREQDRQDEVKTFFQKIGLTPGSKVTVLAERGGKLIVQIRNVRITLPSEVAAKICVEPGK